MVASGRSSAPGVHPVGHHAHTRPDRARTIFAGRHLTTATPVGTPTGPDPSSGVMLDPFGGGEFAIGGWDDDLVRR
jgi:hypothetical protein